MYTEDKKEKEMNDLWAMFGNQNIKNVKSKALDDKYWENHK